LQRAKTGPGKGKKDRGGPKGFNKEKLTTEKGRRGSDGRVATTIVLSHWGTHRFFY